MALIEEANPRAHKRSRLRRLQQPQTHSAQSELFDQDDRQAEPATTIDNVIDEPMDTGDEQRDEDDMSGFIVDADGYTIWQD